MSGPLYHPYQHQQPIRGYLPAPRRATGTYNEYRHKALGAVWQDGDYSSAFRLLGDAFVQPDFVEESLTHKMRALQGFGKVVRADFTMRAERYNAEESRELMGAFTDTKADIILFLRLQERRAFCREGFRAIGAAVREMEEIIGYVRIACREDVPSHVFAEIASEFENAGV